MQIFPDYISEMYYYLHVMSDDDLDEFHINEERCRDELFDEMKGDFDTYGPVTKRRVLDAIDFILSSDDIKKYWRAVVPHEISLEDVDDKPGYLRVLYRKLSGHEPPLHDFGANFELVYGRTNIDVRE